MLGSVYLKYLHETETIPEDVKKVVNNLCIYLSIYLGIIEILEDDLTESESIALDWIYGCGQREVVNYVSTHHPQIFAEFYKKLPREIVQATIAEGTK